MKTTRALVALLCSLSLICCNRSGARYQDQLLKAIEQADAVVIVEHSDREDFFESESTDLADPPRYEYGRVNLDEGAIRQFSADVRNMAPATQDEWPACIFEAHHTILFYEGESVASTMRVCIKCAEVKWDGTKETNPKALITCLKPIITRAGFQTERDWPALAKRQSERLGGQ